MTYWSVSEVRPQAPSAGKRILLGRTGSISD
jgi:hypothetical protein